MPGDRTLMEGGGPKVWGKKPRDRAGTQIFALANWTRGVGT